MCMTRNPSQSLDWNWTKPVGTRFSMLFLALVLAGCASLTLGGKAVDLPDLACPTSPNCVSTQAKDPGHRVSPFLYSGDPQSAFSCLKQAILDMPRSRIVEENSRSLRAEFQSLIFRFVDDGEFRLNETKAMIEFRSASRVGYYDFGVNRRRIENLRERFQTKCHADEKR